MMFAKDKIPDIYIKPLIMKVLYTNNRFDQSGYSI